MPDQEPKEQKPIMPVSVPEVDVRDRYVEIFYQYRPLLFSIAYRMLGSAADAEDMLQETFIRWQQCSQEDIIRSPRAFLVTVISRLCIQHLERARVKREEYVGLWLPEPLFTEGLEGDPSANSRLHESLSMAFLLLLEKLSPSERAVFLLHEVFEYEYPEIAQIIGKTEANCRQILRRARQQITSARPRFEASPERHKQLLEGFLAATSSGDFAGLVALLSNDVVLYSDGGGKAKAALNPIYGRDRVVHFLLGAIRKTVPTGVRTRIEGVNGQPSVIYSPHDGRTGCIVTFDIAGGLIQHIYVVTNPDKLKRFPYSKSGAV